MSSLNDIARQGTCSLAWLIWLTIGKSSDVGRYRDSP